MPLDGISWPYARLCVSEFLVAAVVPICEGCNGDDKTADVHVYRILRQIFNNVII